MKSLMKKWKGPADRSMRQRSQGNRFQRPRRRAVVTLTILLILPFAALEIGTRLKLFDVVSYTNSDKFDVTMRSLENARGAAIGAFGSSETLYGFDPHTFENRSNALGCDLSAFNFGVEGFGPGHTLILLKHLPFREWAPNMKVALVGVSLFEEAEVIPTTRSNGFLCESMAGELQRSIYTSALGRDFGMADLCSPSETGVLDPLAKAASKSLASFRYRNEIRSLILDAPTYLGENRKARMSRVTDRGFYMAASMTPETYRFFIDRWRNRLSREDAWMRPLDETKWAASLEPGGVFDQIKTQFQSMSVVPVFYTLPTNPVMIETVGRAETRMRNSRLMSDWAAREGVGFIDDGVPSDFDPVLDFEDHRHTSASGAAKASLRLADSLNATSIGQAACRK